MPNHFSLAAKGAIYFVTMATVMSFFTYEDDMLFLQVNICFRARVFHWCLYNINIHEKITRF